MLILLWQPAILVAELKPQQNIIAVLVDDSRSMGITENGATREAQADQGLAERRAGASCSRNFRRACTDSTAQLTPRSTVFNELADATAPATHIGDGLKQLAAEASDLPIGAVVLLSDGSDNSGGIDRETISALRSRHIPVHTVGFGAGNRFARRGDRRRRGRAARAGRFASGRGGQLSPARLRRAEGDAHRARRRQSAGAREITFAGDGKIQTEELCCSMPAQPARRSLQFSIDPLPGEQNRANNTVTRLGQRGIRTSAAFCTSKASRAGNTNSSAARKTTTDRADRLDAAHHGKQDLPPGHQRSQGTGGRLSDARRGLFGYQGLIIGSVEAGYFTPAQQDLIREFVDRRGGGLLLLGGRSSLADGGWGGSSLADLLPVVLPNAQEHVPPRPATAELTSAGADSMICRLVEDPARNARALEEAAVPDGLSGSGHAEARRGGAGGNERGRTQDADADHRRIMAAGAPRCWPRREPGAGR